MTDDKRPDSQTEMPDEPVASDHQVQPAARNYIYLQHKDTSHQYEMFENMGIGGDLL